MPTAASTIRWASLLTVPAVLVACDSVDENCTSTWENVLVNASFDDGHTGWTEQPVSPPSICEASQVPFAVDSMPFAACLGTDNDRDGLLTQTITLPDSATRVRLRGKRCLITGEMESADAVDTLSIEVRATSGVTLAALGTWSNKDASSTCDWETFELEAPLTTITPSAELRLRADVDDLRITSFYLDTLQLEVQACR